MSSLEGNKIVAAILVGGIITLGVGIAANFIYRPGHEEGGEAEPGVVASVTSPAVPEPLLPLLADADLAKGETTAKKCLTCHVFDKGGPNKVGPNLWGVIGRKAGTHEGFPYSEAMKNSGKTWTYTELNQFLTNPREAVPGTKMSFPGLPAVQDRANVIAWLRTKADSEPPLPTAEEITAEATQYAATGGPAMGTPAPQATDQPAPENGAAAPAAPQDAAAQDPMALIAAADPAQGAKIAKKCLSCHSFDKGGPNKVGPNLWGVIGRKSGSHEGFAYSEAMKNAGKAWNLEELNTYLTDPKKTVPGTKMSFVGLKDAQERAALLRWLRDQSDNPVPLP